MLSKEISRSLDYFFSGSFTYVEAVKLKYKVLAPYRVNGVPKDWVDEMGGKFRWYYHDLWTDTTIPFWSMSENMRHLTQKSEKLIAKLVMASSDFGDVVLDSFVGSGTASVLAKKLGRSYICIDSDEAYCCLTEKRLLLAKKDKTIHGSGILLTL